MIGKRNVNIGIDKAAKSAGITKISHVDRSKKKYGFFGSRSKYTTKVYGEKANSILVTHPCGARRADPFPAPICLTTRQQP